MKITFHIQYRTIWGENLRVILNEDPTQTLELNTKDGIEWEGSYDCNFDTLITYRYGVYRDNICIRKELGAIPHSLHKESFQQVHYIVKDCWRDLPENVHLYSSAFNGNYIPSQLSPACNHAGSCITFRAICPRLSIQKQSLGIIGSCNALGNWEPCRPIKMQEIQPNVWHISFDTSKLEFPFEYKFVAIHQENGAVKEWECHDNRIFDIQPLQRGETFIQAETEVFFPEQKIRIAGSAIPVFSLRSEGSYGVGDFGDLKKFIKWAAHTGQKAVQILPINDTTMSKTWTDSYPYSSISIYALHPMFVDLRQLPVLKDWKLAKEFEATRIQVNALQQVDYEAVNRLKLAYLKVVFTESGTDILNSEDFQNFLEENKEWLQPYAVFCYLREKYGTPDFSLWKEYSIYQKELVASLCTPQHEAYTEISFYYFVQYELHIQLLDTCNYGRQLGVIVKGDIPIGISRTSVEAWVEPHYFNMNGQAGAPPDAFSTQGQNWGMPTYNWNIMEKDGYQWWLKRFRKMAKYFTAYRIDHILGFFRIWEIPTHAVYGLLGQFSPALPMSKEEIQSFGLNFQKEFMTQPFINDQMLHTIFGENCSYVKNTFLQHLHNDIYCMQPEFNTQRKVEIFFQEKNDSDSLRIKEGIYSLISNVLFVVDRNNPEKYHPRISAQNDFIFKQLTKQEQEAFNHLYNHYYYHRHNEFWYKEAMKKLPILTQSTSMLVCGEDLGMVPDCVPWVMEELQILSLEIQRMPKNPAHKFGHVSQYPYRSVCTIGTHDMTTLRGWWKEDYNITEQFYQEELNHWDTLPLHAPASLCEEIICQHLESPSMLCILTWQDWTSLDENIRNPHIETERINIPANPKHYWRWRMHITLEKLMQAESFNQKINAMIVKTQRG